MTLTMSRTMLFGGCAALASLVLACGEGAADAPAAEAGGGDAPGVGAGSGVPGTGGAAPGGTSGTGSEVGSGGTPGAGGNGSGGTGGVGGGGASLPGFILGADITITLEDEYWGATYTDDGAQKPLEQILRDHGFNFVRIDTFVDPSAAGGYAASKEQPFRSLAHTVTLAKRAKAIDLGFLLDLHMSDTWTNPGAQAMPASFVGLSLPELEDAVHAYVLEAVGTLVEEGARPDMVQIGNEITNGFMWETGRIVNDDFGNFAALLEAGISAVREVDPSIRIVLHIEKCNDLGTTRWWLDGVLGEGVEFDVLGQSCYAAAPDGAGGIHHPGYQGTPSEWSAVFATLATEYPDLTFIIAEYSAEQRAANDVMRALPDGRGLGTFNWDPTRFYETHPNVPLFETAAAWNDYVAIDAMLGLYDQMAEDYGLR